MSSFTDQALEKKLQDLNNTQQSVQTLSLWLIHHRKHAKAIVATWYRDLLKVKPSRKLVYVYLANDVIQNSKKKGPEFSQQFAVILPKAFHHVAKSAVGDGDNTGTKLVRIINIWGERAVYEGDFLTKLKAAVSLKTGHSKRTTEQPAKQEAKQEAVPANSSVATTTGPTPSKRKKKEIVNEEEEENDEIPPEKLNSVQTDDLVKCLEDLENAASGDAHVREKIASLPPEVQDVSILDKIQERRDAERLSKIVDNACELLQEYNCRLSTELEDRKKVQQMLKIFIAYQKDQLTKSQQKLEEYRSKLTKVTSVRKELKSHIQSLPDLTKLPDVSGGWLAPLPSAGDLFNSESKLDSS